MLSKYVGRKTSSIENDITKARNHSRQRGNIMRVVFGIDVSKASSEVAILVNGEKVHDYTIPNDAIGFNRLLGDLKTVHQPEIVFEATGVYSRRLQAFLDEHGYAYTRLNPLESKNQLDSLRVRKTDKIDAEKLARSQFVLNLKLSELMDIIRQSTSKRISDKRVSYLTEKLTALAKQSYCAVKKTSPILEEVRYYAKELLRLSDRRKAVLDDMVKLAQSLPEYEILLSIPGIAETTSTSIIGELGDIRRLQSANQINAFIGIDLRHYKSGNFLAKECINKRGNPYARKILFKCIHNIASAIHTKPCDIADFYQKRKQQSQTASTKPHTIAAIHRLIRTMYYLITHNKFYDYNFTQNR